MRQPPKRGLVGGPGWEGGWGCSMDAERGHIPALSTLY